MTRRPSIVPTEGTTPVGLLHGATAGAAAPRMTRRIRLRRHEPRELYLNIVPLVDVTFLLMVFFVIAGTFESWEGVLSSKLLRGGKGSASVALPISPVILRVKTGDAANGTYQLQIDGVARVPKSFAELAVVLGEVLQQPGFGADTPVVVVADGRVPWDHVVNAWNAALRAGFVRIAFGDP